MREELLSDKKNNINTKKEKESTAPFPITGGCSEVLSLYQACTETGWVECILRDQETKVFVMYMAECRPFWEYWKSDN